MATNSVVDTVVLRNFLFVGRLELLIDLLGSPIGIPRLIFDPDEAEDAPELAMSELTRSIRVQELRAADPERDEDARKAASLNARALQAVHEISARDIETIDLTVEEQELWARLRRREEAARFGLSLELGSGEAACMASAVNRNLVMVTDDSDALLALDAISPGHRYERIRKLLFRAADGQFVTESEAIAIHQEMKSLGFRDRGDMRFLPARIRPKS